MNSIENVLIFRYKVARKGIPLTNITSAVSVTVELVNVPWDLNIKLCLYPIWSRAHCPPFHPGKVGTKNGKFIRNINRCDRQIFYSFLLTIFINSASDGFPTLP